MLKIGKSYEKEFEEYQRILQYLNTNPDKIIKEERYVTGIVDRLVELSMFNNKVSQNLRDLICETLEDFLNKKNGYHYLDENKDFYYIKC